MASPSVESAGCRVKSVSPGHNKQPRKLYECRRLAEGEIRILTLLPGQFDDEICIRIGHIKLPVAGDPNSSRMTRKELNKTLPPGWTAEEILDGRFIFVEWNRCIKYDDRIEYSDGIEYDNGHVWMKNGAGRRINMLTWTHPDPDIHRLQYELPSYDEYQCMTDTYEALSYVWGSELTPDFAFVETPDGIPAGTVSIAKNLSSALRHLRYGDKPRKLWVDAICINQHNDAEKSIQVRRMASVYRRASRVIAWIGPEADGSSSALSTLEYLGNQIVIANHGSFALPSPNAQERTWYKRNRPLPYDANTWKALESLLDREWFDRRWVVQEIGVANNLAVLQCGKREFSWASFTHAVACLAECVPRTATSLRLSLNRARAFVYDYRRGLTARSVLQNNNHTLCSELVDNVYALLGVMPPKFAAHIIPDYSQSPADSFRDMFLAHTRQTQRWELFGCALQDRQCDGPSWVPDLSDVDSTSRRVVCQFSSGYARMCFTYRDSDVLEVTGVQCATVATASSPLPRVFADDGEGMQTAKRLIRSWEPDNMETSTYITGASLSDVHALTLLNYQTKERWPLTVMPTLKEWQASGGNGLFRPAAGTMADLSALEQTRWDAYAYDSFRTRAYIVTEEGYIGLGPPGVKPGLSYSVVLLVSYVVANNF